MLKVLQRHGFLEVLRWLTPYLLRFDPTSDSPLCITLLFVFRV